MGRYVPAALGGSARARSARKRHDRRDLRCRALGRSRPRAEARARQHACHRKRAVADDSGMVVPCRRVRGRVAPAPRRRDVVGRSRGHEDARAHLDNDAPARHAGGPRCEARGGACYPYAAAHARALPGAYRGGRPTRCGDRPLRHRRTARDEYAARPLVVRHASVCPRAPGARPRSLACPTAPGREHRRGLRRDGRRR